MGVTMVVIVAAAALPSGPTSYACADTVACPSASIVASVKVTNRDLLVAATISPLGITVPTDPVKVSSPTALAAL